MRTFFFFCALLLGIMPLRSQRTVGIRAADISFVFLNKDVEGHIGGFTSTSKIDLARPEQSIFKGSVAVETLKTGNFIRDWSLKGGKYFDADTYPIISFESASVTETDSGYSINGTLTLKGIEKSLAIDFKREDTQLIGTTKLNSADYGIHIKKAREENWVRVRLVLTIE